MNILLSFLHLFVIKDNCILRYLWSNLRNILMPVFLAYFIIQFFPTATNHPTEYLRFVYTGIFYIVLTNTIPEKLSRWFYLEQQRGTLETIAMTKLGIMGIIRYSFLLYLIIFLFIEAPIFIVIAKAIFGIQLSYYMNGIFYIFVLFNILLSFGISLLSIAFILLFNKHAFFASSRNYIYNLFSGVYCSVAIFPLFIKLFSYALPFTYGIIILRNIVRNEKGIYLYLGIFILYAIVIVIIGHFFIKKILIYIMKKRSLTSYG